jgi:glycosyltransferase involved in cell wall biosynthesis
VALLSRAAHPLHAPGGLERAVFHLATHLQALGIETVLLTRTPTREGQFPGEVLTFPYGHLPAVRHGRVLDRLLHYPPFADRLGRAVADLVRTGRVDIVHAQGLTALGYARARRQDPALRAPLIMNPQGMEEHKVRGMKALVLTRIRALSREAARLADRVIATDEVSRAEVPQYLGVDPTRVVVLPNGIDPRELDAATPAQAKEAVHAAVPLAGRAPVILSVGRLEAYKGFGDILQALRLAESRGGLPRDWAWVVVGEGPYGAKLRQSAGAWVGDRVHLLGAVDESLLHALYERADVFVHATHFEGSSLVTLEAMAHGLPVVGARAGGIPDKVVDGETGWLFGPGDIPALARQLERISAGPEERRRFGAAGRERARTHFGWPRIAADTVALYRELLGRAS